MTLTALNAISPIDGRYVNKTRVLSPYFSEFALTYYRLMVEIKWFESLAANDTIPEVPALDNKARKFLSDLISNFNESEAEKIKEFEKQTNHDVKAVEYYLKDKFQENEQLKSCVAFIHFACTSEDINNLAYALMIKQAIAQVIQPTIAEIMGSITLLGKQHADVAMLSRTHGQPATPTTMGKELVNFVARLKRPQQQLAEVLIPAKFNGAVGNYNAHVAAYPEVDWRKHCANFVTSLGLSFNAYTTQIEPHDGIAEVSQIMVRINNILLDYTQDIWSYISLGYFKQKTVAEEVGSSTMPHKVNPIDFENAEGNLGLSNALFIHFANKLTQSRMQRDLSDSTVLRNLGVAFSYSLIAYHSVAKGNDKLQINKSALQKDLSENWEVLAEAIQTVMRRYNEPNAYEQLKELTRGQMIDAENLKQFIKNLPIPEEAKAELMKLTPETYTGLATQLVKAFS
ncbi:TPA: adenylosuccinate lyase [Legionella pneumophila]|uniref:adenylosuccinate lyase n=1 Tax=Legionella sp. PATHC039 TaxID=2992042 RepID=UPI0007782996|nr:MULTISPECIES: adenylosuccinate lyase [Legionella]HAT8858961.1 adenylosuccinate lyase [Legionella pneumophila subsp. pneumophila]MCW8395566.1 adenylosuccinate lyase [Legionella sp. PATHC039]HAT7072214.1 adenylosuccinate lyase [Legionella pneumophila]HAT8640898.1 adenylosuccinate lyase [Legionella pneumophila]HAT8867799.1 adenylosuccinate lyase [Legionella pneumophila subsp. pneumophila]